VRIDPIVERAQQEAALRQTATTLIEKIRMTLEQVDHLVSSRLDLLSGYAVELGISLASQILGAELEAGRYNPAPVVQECLHAAVQKPGAGTITVLLNPGDLSLVLSTLEESSSLEAKRPEVHFDVDPDLPRGACRVETRVGHVVSDPLLAFEEAAQRIREEARE